MRLVAFLLVIVIPVALLSIDIRDYKFPESFFQEAYLRGDFTFRDGNQDQSSYDGSFGGNYNVNYNSLPFTWRLALDGAIDLKQGPMETDDSMQGYHIFINTNADRYLGETDAFAYGAAEFGYRERLAADEADDPYAKIGVGAGYGRIIDATVLARAIGIVDELLKYNVINRRLSDTAYIELAQIIDKESEYKAQYGGMEYKRYWLEAMEEVFLRDGVLVEEYLGAMGIVRIQDVLDMRFSTRKHGWMIRGGIGYILSNYDGSDSDPTLDVSFELAHPFSYKLQLIERLDYSTVLEDDLSHRVINRLSVSYQLSLQTDWVNSLVNEFVFPAEGDTIQNHMFESSFYYYLTNQLNLNTTLRFSLYDDGTGIDDDLVTTFIMGISYRLR